ncbi:RsiG family protein [Dermatobacter hominis]|uniref:RsiG family protein n=1 Tax=Dermatobacter hominis TaxID=2884263 RepID=UPI001D12B65F|nr:hypothetical protein [Dermatobacter hominis]UDY34008.1 hypothetical protein LH044_11690 [Dermatobacter hominis]
MDDITVEQLINFDEPGELTSCSLVELRAVREDYQAVENGLSYARRIVQGRLDTVAVELERRAEQDPDTDLVHRLPSALAAHTRGPGLPRPGQDLDPPPWADEIVARADQLLGASMLSDLASVPEPDLLAAMGALAALERDVSSARREVHTRMDRVQDEIVARYQAGASVDDLLR